MKRYMKTVYAGISGHLDPDTGKYKFKVDFDRNSHDDIVNFISPYFVKSSIDNNTYWFGYAFNDGQANPRRDQFIEFIKSVQIGQLADPDDEWSNIVYNDSSITESELNTMVIRSIDNIHLKKYDIDCIVYPESNSGNLVKMIARCIKQYAEDSKPIAYAELKKSDPSDLDFDYLRFASDIAEEIIRVPEYVDDEYIANMMQRARTSNTFSLRRCIKPVVLRNYVSNFYSVDAVLSPVINADVVLVVDDFGTTGTTIKEMIRNIRKVNKECEIYIFTLMGKSNNSNER